MIDLNGTCEPRAEHGSNAGSSAALAIHERAKRIEKSRDFYYWMNHKNRDLALSEIKHTALSCSRTLKEGTSASFNESRCTAAKSFVLKFK